MAEIRRSSNFDLLVSTGEDGDYLLRVLSTPGVGETAAPVPAANEPLKSLAAALLDWRALTLDRRGLRDLGAKFMAWLFPPPIALLYRGSLARLGSDEGLRMRLLLEPAELHEMPWECLYDAELGVFLAQDVRTPFVRHLLGPFAPGKLAGSKLRVLVAIALPRHLPPLRADEEYDRIEEILDELGDRVQVRRAEATIDGLQGELRRGADVLHFIGHGGFDAELGSYLVLKGERGRPQTVDAEVLAGLVRGSGLRLAVLSACESGRADPARSFNGLASRLAQAGVPAVVAMQTALPDKAGPEFGRAFYGALAGYAPVDAAVTASRQALFAHAPDSPTWCIPVLYLSAPDGLLWERENASQAPHPPSPPTTEGTSSFQFNFQGPVTIQAGVMGGNQYVTHAPKPEDDP